ncbi:MAG: antitoxin Xre-like helix-turn-helix domain-containing protein [Gammaproteobacteria bacterium]|nr:antitoxin Xre-like helix-turn-helix domain-containing protein [Gammaproteobacteria bacterium]
MSEAGLAAFFSIAREIGLSTEQQITLLGSPGRTTFFEWKKKLHGQLSHDAMDRLSYIIGIYKAVQMLFSGANVQEWLTNVNNNPIFCGKSPLEYMLSGHLVALADVRRYLDSIVQ